MKLHRQVWFSTKFCLFFVEKIEKQREFSNLKYLYVQLELQN
jgi:hypothetical protein